MKSQEAAALEPRPDGRSHHDMGGLSAGPIDRSEHEYAMWEKRVDALMTLLSSPRHELLKVDELRRHIEGLGAAAYNAMSYYERWMAAISATLIERGVISIDALGRKMAEIEERYRTALEP
jgi:Nitrile hydratase beta subunit